MSKNYLMVRAMLSKEKDFELFFSKSIVAVGWSKVDFTTFASSEPLIKKLAEVYYQNGQTAPQVIGKKLNEAKRFREIKQSDYILVPYLNSVCLAIAKNKRIYDKSIAQTLDLANQLEVDYKRIKGQPQLVPRNDLSEGLQRRLRVRGSTCSDLYEFADEIEALFGEASVTIEAKVAHKEAELLKEFKRTLLKNIQSGKTYLQTGGIGLENLVKELLECEGYQAKVLSKRAFKGQADADIHASRADRFKEQKLLIQVKHHSGFTDEWGLKQLKLIKEMPEYKDYTMALLTSANFNEQLKSSCEQAGVQAIDGNELVEWIIECGNKLSPLTKSKLGISGVPSLLM